jgi:hypothetical protein
MEKQMSLAENTENRKPKKIVIQSVTVPSVQFAKRWKASWAARCYTSPGMVGSGIVINMTKNNFAPIDAALWKKYITDTETFLRAYFPNVRKTEHYREWVRRWRAEYKNLTAISRLIKRQRKSLLYGSDVPVTAVERHHELSRLANGMLIKREIYKLAFKQAQLER